jgi:hypothetical protein
MIYYSYKNHPSCRDILYILIYSHEAGNDRIVIILLDMFLWSQYGPISWRPLSMRQIFENYHIIVLLCKRCRVMVSTMRRNEGKSYLI